jgi:hypothetical protein
MICIAAVSSMASERIIARHAPQVAFGATLKDLADRKRARTGR